MACVRPLPSSAHDVFRVSKISLSFLSLFMACLCVFLIRRTPSISKEYGSLLLMLIVVATQQDIFTQLIFDPQYIFIPDMCVFRDAPLFNIPLNAAWAFIVWVTLVALHPPAYAACFLYRHQLIVPDDSYFKLPPYGTFVCVIIIAIPFLTYGSSYYLAWISPNDTIKQACIASEWDPISISRMECFLEYQDLRNAWAFALFLTCVVFCFFISLHTFSILRNAANLSTKTRLFHRTMLLSLIVVAVIPILLIVVPFAIAMPYYTIVVHNQLPVMEIGTFFFAFHSVVHSLVLILTTPVFRTRLTQMLPRKSTSVSVKQPDFSSNITSRSVVN